MNRYMEYAVKKFEEQFQVKIFCSPVYYTGKGQNIIEDVMFYTDHEHNELKAKVSTYVLDEQLIFTFIPRSCTWECLSFN